MEDDEDRKAANANQEDVRHHYDSAYVTIMSAHKGKESLLKELAECMAWKENSCYIV